ncbi:MULTISPECIES: response regulator transcription factor [Rhodococcus]|uniref:response regulator transcription factor n=1 Tax=Rhodococcus TaxID=1827 RepID=UPI000C7DA510|nr:MULTISPECIES: response regulator transcription factor [Rhodococcus]AUM16540.1 DNA-binding response regulator [Rhodococcus ruber]
MTRMPGTRGTPSVAGQSHPVAHPLRDEERAAVSAGYPGRVHTPGPRILVVDDEAALAKVVASYLEREGFEVALAHDGPTAVALARRTDPVLVVLDLMLPGFDGIEVCRQLRTFSDAYVLMLTARGDEVDKVIGLSVGADDYVVKPFGPRELVARVRAMLRRPRSGTASEAPRRIGGLVVDPVSRTVSVDDAPVALTRTEFDVLLTLSDRPSAALSRRQIIDEVWGPNWFGDEHIVDVHIRALRRKLGDDAAAPRFVRTVRGVGYAMEATG